MDKTLIIKRIKSYKKFTKDKEVADFLGIKPQTLANWITRNSLDFELIFTKCEDVNLDWLINGKEKLETEKQATNMIPFYDGIAVGGTFEVANMDVEQPVEYIDAGDWFRDATAAMRVHGDSMHPEYKSGSIAALKLVNDKRLIVYGQDYVIETSEYRVIKRLQKGSDSSSWTCRSLNQEKYQDTNDFIHQPFEVPIDAVSRMYKVLGCVTRTESSRIVLNNNNNSK